MKIKILTSLLFSLLFISSCKEFSKNEITSSSLRNMENPSVGRANLPEGAKVYILENDKNFQNLTVPALKELLKTANDVLSNSVYQPFPLPYFLGSIGNRLKKLIRLIINYEEYFSSNSYKHKFNLFLKMKKDLGIVFTINPNQEEISSPSLDNDFTRKFLPADSPLEKADLGKFEEIDQFMEEAFNSSLRALELFTGELNSYEAVILMFKFIRAQLNRLNNMIYSLKYHAKTNITLSPDDIIKFDEEKDLNKLNLDQFKNKINPNKPDQKYVFPSLEELMEQRDPSQEITLYNKRVIAYILVHYSSKKTRRMEINREINSELENQIDSLFNAISSSIHDFTDTTTLIVELFDGFSDYKEASKKIVDNLKEFCEFLEETGEGSFRETLDINLKFTRDWILERAAMY